MKKIYLTESQLKNYLRYLNEEEYCYQKRIGPFSTPAEAETVLYRLRAENGFSEYDSRIDGNYVVIDIEKDRYDDDYLGNMLTTLNKQYGKVAESRE